MPCSIPAGRLLMLSELLSSISTAVYALRDLYSALLYMICRCCNHQEPGKLTTKTTITVSAAPPQPCSGADLCPAFTCNSPAYPKAVRPPHCHPGPLYLATREDKRINHAWLLRFASAELGFSLALLPLVPPQKTSHTKLQLPACRGSSCRSPLYLPSMVSNPSRCHRRHLWQGC